MWLASISASSNFESEAWLCSLRVVVALDFDGVLLDTEPERAQVAWRASCGLWPQLPDLALASAEIVKKSRSLGKPGQLGGARGGGSESDARSDAVAELDRRAQRCL